jgi:hypothetical protein
MKHQYITGITVAASCFVIGAALAAQTNRATVKSPNGIALSEMKGYEAWQVIAPSQTNDGIKAITGNAVMIKAYRDGFPGNGKTVPDGAMMAKIEWAKKPNPASPYPVNVPDKLKSLSFMVKDAKRFPDTDGWGYAQFTYDPASDTLKPYGDAATSKTYCHPCHVKGATKARDFVYTNYPLR